MIGFFTSISAEWGDTHFLADNGFAEMLRKYLKSPCNVLNICSSPDNYKSNDKYAGEVFECVKNLGVELGFAVCLDERNMDKAAELVKTADLIFVAGGHVPTQNEFINRLHLPELVKDFDGVVIGRSAGSMNSACTVYSQPEDPGESVSPDYKRFLHGLGFTDINIIPHYDRSKDFMLDGKRLFEDITYPDSMGRRFLVLPDRSFLFSDNGKETVFGEAYLLKDSVLTKICENGQSVTI